MKNNTKTHEEDLGRFVRTVEWVGCEAFCRELSWYILCFNLKTFS